MDDVRYASLGRKPIEGVDTSTAGFAGPTRFGPTTGEPPLLTSFSEFERVYGGLDGLTFEGEGRSHNDVAHAVRAFFDNGGRRLYVSRVYEEGGDGRAATGTLGDLELQARWPGAAGSFTVRFSIDLSEDTVVPAVGGAPTALTGVQQYDTVLVSAAAGATSAGIDAGLYYLDQARDTVRGIDTWALMRAAAVEDPPLMSADGTGVEVRVVTVSVSTAPMGRFMGPRTWDGLAPHRKHPRSMFQVFAPAVAARRSTELYVPLVISADPEETGVEVVAELLSESTREFGPTSLDSVAHFDSLGGPFEVTCQLVGGSDGARPGPAAYEGRVSAGSRRSGLQALEELEDISVVAAPGSTREVLGGSASGDAGAIQQLLIGHAERMRYRIAVLDSPRGASPNQIRGHRATMDSRWAALYYPWVSIDDPITQTDITVPPSGFMAGIYARNDIERGVHHAPANQVVRLAVGFEYMLNHAEQGLLNPIGVNCLRFFQGRGHRVWGARTITSDPEWKYVNVQRYVTFLEQSIDRGTRWVVFEPNAEPLWTDVRRSIDDFLVTEWRSGHLTGNSPEDAFFVRCDRSTMTQDDIDEGRLVCLIGVAPLRPGEFVIVRIGQTTMSAPGKA